MDDAERTELSWSGWGDPGRAAPLPPAQLELLRGVLGVATATLAPGTISEPGPDPPAAGDQRGADSNRR